ncbi:Glutamate 5-kinase 1 [Kingella potus]|uniref:Glutamate 5-kinase n=1 Tax=Kingella potus TaxID=265175 RepID=A0A377QXX7_9NEIS|nr:glutamate 5-kinase [Kingella potus]STR00216.1 Glutamate 5-kinase 1 [Kingella potus]
MQSKKRIVYKVGTSSLTEADGSLSHAKLRNLTRQLAALHAAGHELVLVSSGAVTAGFASLGFKKRPSRIADRQAAAAVGQSLLMEEYTAAFLLKGIVAGQILLTRDDFADPRRYRNAFQTLGVLLARRAVPVINENDVVAVAELKVGDNDTLAAQVASMLRADLLVLLTDVDGLYTGNPRTDPQARRLDRVGQIGAELIAMAGGAGSANGTGGMATKIKAAALATHAGVPVYICSSLQTDALFRAAFSQDDGTLFAAQKTMKTQKQWLAFYAPSRGSLKIDAGAEHAIVHEGRSLLASGITEVRGQFAAGDVLTVFNADGSHILGKGRAKTDSGRLKTPAAPSRPKGIAVHRDDWIGITPELELFLKDI